LAGIGKDSGCTGSGGAANPHWGAPRIHGELMKLKTHESYHRVLKKSSEKKLTAAFSSTKTGSRIISNSWHL
jgi:hypothetical protein